MISKTLHTNLLLQLTVLLLMLSSLLVNPITSVASVLFDSDSEVILSLSDLDTEQEEENQEHTEKQDETLSNTIIYTLNTSLIHRKEGEKIAFKAIYDSIDLELIIPPPKA